MEYKSSYRKGMRLDLPWHIRNFIDQNRGEKSQQRFIRDALETMMKNAYTTKGVDENGSKGSK